MWQTLDAGRLTAKVVTWGHARGKHTEDLYRKIWLVSHQSLGRFGLIMLTPSPSSKSSNYKFHKSGARLAGRQCRLTASFLQFIALTITTRSPLASSTRHTAVAVLHFFSILLIFYSFSPTQSCNTCTTHLARQQHQAHSGCSAAVPTVDAMLEQAMQVGVVLVPDLQERCEQGTASTLFTPETSPLAKRPVVSLREAEVQRRGLQCNLAW